MTAGYLLDQTHGSRNPTWWVEGAVEKSMILGTKLRGHDIYINETYRCESCGLLKSYARHRRK